MNLNNYLELSQLKDFSKNVRKVFFYRVCGTGMAAAACLLKESGFDVTGGDSNFYPPMSDYLKTTKIKIVNLSEVDQKFLQQFDLIVVGNVVRKDGPDALLIEESGVKFCSFPALLGALVLGEKKVVGIAGTHGKTTTTYLFTQVFENMGYLPGHFIGGVMDDRPPAVLGKDSYFFIESDEYDSAYFEKYSKFLSYEIDHLIWTSLEFDHGDIYQSIDDIMKQFSALLDKISGICIYNSDYKIIDDVFLNQYKKIPHLSYNIKKDNALNITDVSSSGTTFNLKFKNQIFKFSTNIVGEHNILNLSSVVLFALSEGIEVNKVAEAIKDLKMVKRRQEVKGQFKKATIIDDFAHHPTAVDVTIRAIKQKFPKSLISVVFEPASATARSNIFEADFAHALSLADRVCLMPPPALTSVKNSETINLSKVKHIVDANKVKCDIINNVEDLIHEIKISATQDQAWVIMSNGKCQGFWESEFVKNLTPYNSKHSIG